MKKPVATIKVELPAMTAKAALAETQKLVDAIKEGSDVRVKAVGVTMP